MKGFILFSLILILSATIILAIPNPGHSAEEILITINSKMMTLQEAMDNNFLKDTIALPNTEGTTSLIKSHPADNLQIYLGERLYLQEAINKIGATTSIANKGFCRDAPGFFSWLFNLGHDADQILFNDGETLQEKINSQQFCSYKWKNDINWGGCSANPYWGSPTACSVSCGVGTKTLTCLGNTGTKTRNVWCKRSDGTTDGITDTYCINDGQGTKPIESQSCTEECLGTGTESCDVGSTTCGWSNWTITSTCSYTGACGVGTYRRTRSCDIGVAGYGHCIGSSYDYNGGECLVGSDTCGCGTYGECSACHVLTQKGSCDITGRCVGGCPDGGSSEDLACVAMCIIDPIISCFPAGTKITISDGTIKNIEDVKIGDNILSFDETIQEQRIGKVLELESPIRDHMCKISFEDKSSIKLTDEHPIYTNNGWKSIDPLNTLLENPNLDFVFELNVGDNVLFEDNNYKKVIDINCWKEIIQTYNLKNIEGYNNFYAEGVLVHNKVLCTETHRQGYISDEWLEANHEFAEEYIDSTTLLGYHSWAKPLVRILQKDEEIGKIASFPLTIEWTKHIAYLMGYNEEDSEIGKVLVEIGVPFSRELGKRLSKDGYNLDNEYEFDDEFIKSIFLKHLTIFSDESLSENKEVIKNNFENFLEEMIEFYEYDSVRSFL